MLVFPLEGPFSLPCDYYLGNHLHDESQDTSVVGRLAT
jgi:hypothetical protein